MTIFCGEVFGDFLSEEFHQGFNPFFARNLRDVRGGFDAKAGNFRLHEVLQQVAVVAGDFDDEALAVQSELFHVAIARFARVAEHEIGERGEIKILGEQLDRWNEVGDLEHPAGFADSEAERKLRLLLREVGGIEEIVRQRLLAEVEDVGGVGAAAGPAFKTKTSRSHFEQEQTEKTEKRNPWLISPFPLFPPVKF